MNPLADLSSLRPLHRELGLAPSPRGPIGLVGPSGCGKSILAYHLAVTVACGQPAAWGVPGLARHGEVVYLTTPGTAIRRHLAALAMGMGASLDGASLLRGDLPSWDKLDATAREQLFAGRALVVFDNLLHLATDASLPGVVRTLAEIRDLSFKHNCAAVVVHQEVTPSFKDTRAFDVGALDRFWSTLWVVDMPQPGVMHLRRQLHPHVAQTIDLKITGDVENGERLEPIPVEPPC